MATPPPPDKLLFSSAPGHLAIDNRARIVFLWCRRPKRWHIHIDTSDIPYVYVYPAHDTEFHCRYWSESVSNVFILKSKGIHNCLLSTIDYRPRYRDFFIDYRFQVHLIIKVRLFIELLELHSFHLNDGGTRPCYIQVWWILPPWNGSISVWQRVWPM